MVFLFWHMGRNLAHEENLPFLFRKGEAIHGYQQAMLYQGAVRLVTFCLIRQSLRSKGS